MTVQLFREKRRKWVWEGRKEGTQARAEGAWGIKKGKTSIGQGGALRYIQSEVRCFSRKSCRKKVKNSDASQGERPIQRSDTATDKGKESQKHPAREEGENKERGGRRPYETRIDERLGGGRTA